MNVIKRHLPFTTPSSSPPPPQRPSILTLTDAELVELRAAQRTFEGAYIRTALGQFAFALVVLRIFTAEFYAVGALFAAYGAGIALIALYRRHQGNSQFFIDVTRRENDAREQQQVRTRKFRTSGNVVLLLTGVSLGAYVVLLVLILRLKNY